MKPAEIDWQIGIKVMGWVVEQGGPYRGSDAMWCTPPTEGMVCGTGQKFVDNWQPSTNISHAMQALESDKLKGTMRLTINTRKKYVHFTCWCPDTQRVGEADVDVTDGIEKAAAMAISLALVAAVKDQE